MLSYFYLFLSISIHFFSVPIVLAQSSDEIRVVPYRLMTESNEEIEISFHYTADYKGLVKVSYDITQPTPDGTKTFRLKANEGGFVTVTMTIKDNRVVSGEIGGEAPAGQAAQVLSVNSRSGEQLKFSFNGPGTSGAGGATVGSDRLK